MRSTSATRARRAATRPSAGRAGLGPASQLAFGLRAFGQLAGLRPASAQPCFSHPDVIDRMTEKVLAALKDYGPNSQIAMAQMDADLCHCERCTDLVIRDGREPYGAGGENWGAPMFLAINHVAREVAKVRPFEKYSLMRVWSAW